MKLSHLENLDIEGKRVFLRLDLNVPLKDGKITDTTRIEQALPTLRYVLERTNRVCIASHLGRPKGQHVSHLSLAPVGVKLSELLGKEILLVKDYLSEPADQMMNQMGKNQLILLENLRFYGEETKNDRSFAESLSKGIDYYINDAFGAVHRAHSSIVGIPEVLQRDRCAAGFLIQKETRALDRLTGAASPFVVIVGGAKVSDKMGVMLNLLKRCNHLVIGGAMAYSFLKHQGYDVGASRVETDQLHLVDAIFRNAKDRKVKIHLPVDHVCSTEFSEDSTSKIIDGEAIPAPYMGLDIGPKTRAKYADVIRQGKTVLWNGPMGVFEWENFAHGTRSVAQEVAYNRGYTVIGGGDSVSSLNKLGLSEEISHVSTGGGASLEYLEGLKLPGLKALEQSDS